MKKNKTFEQRFLDTVDSFQSETNLADSYIGKAAVNNSELIKRLRKGGKLYADTAERVEAWMNSYRAAQRAAAE